MTTITINYFGNKIDTVNNSFYNAFGKELLRKEYVQILENSIKNLSAIDRIIEKIKTIECAENLLTPNTVFTVNIGENRYYLSNYFEILSDKDFLKLNFVYHVKFDKSNCDITKEENRLNETMKYKNSEEATAYIEKYISKLPNSFKNISDKPKKLSLFCFNQQNDYIIRN